MFKNLIGPTIVGPQIPLFLWNDPFLMGGNGFEKLMDSEDGVGEVSQSEMGIYRVHRFHLRPSGYLKPN